MPVFVQRSRLEVPAAEVFAWHARPGAFERLLPPWEDLRVVERRGTIRDGDRLVLELRRGPFRRCWVAEHRDYEEGRQFRDVQLEGPFAVWEHTHRTIPDGPEACVLEDEVRWELPGGRLGAALGEGLAARQLARLFGFRHARTRLDLGRHARVAAHPRLRVVVSGASGLVGSSLVPFLTTGAHRVDRLVRRRPAPGSTDVVWDPAQGRLDPSALEGADAVVHLAGESVAGRWTAARRAAIRESRVAGTRLLVETLARLRRPPRVLVSASAVGFYGPRGDEPLTEAAESGGGFLADVCRAWEAAAVPAQALGIRLVLLRIGVVLSARGGALARLLPPFRLGAGGPVGSGRQAMSWIALDDLVGAVHHVLFDDAVSGPVNATAPAPVTNADFARTLGRVLGRPAVLPLPAPAVRLAFGAMGDEMLLAGQRVLPARLEAARFAFAFPALEGALRHELGRPA
jgi:uncharacterized protein (TIGR01777 family)